MEALQFVATLLYVRAISLILTSDWSSLSVAWTTESYIPWVIPGRPVAKGSCKKLYQNQYTWLTTLRTHTFEMFLIVESVKLAHSETLLSIHSPLGSQYRLATASMRVSLGKAAPYWQEIDMESSAAVTGQLYTPWEEDTLSASHKAATNIGSKYR